MDSKGPRIVRTWDALPPVVYDVGEAFSTRALERQHRQMEAALKRIAKWFGEFPSTGCFYKDTGEQMSHGAVYGSNGERDFMRQIAQDALPDP